MNYYVSNYGICNGIQFIYYIGAAGMDNGVITFIQQDIAKGDPSAESLVAFEEQYYLDVQNGYVEIPSGLTEELYLQRLEQLYVYGEYSFEGASGAISAARKIITEAGVSDTALVKWGISSDKDIIKFADFIEDGLKPNSDMFFYEWFNRSSFKFSELENLSINTYQDLNKALVDFERFGDEALEHIFKGQVKLDSNGVEYLSGYHCEGYPSSVAKVTSITKAPNEFGIYEATVASIDGSVTKNGISTFFPKDWTPKQVEEAIMEAYWNRTAGADGWYYGTTSSGMEIQLGIKNNGFAEMPRIVTAFPVY